MPNKDEAKILKENRQFGKRIKKIFSNRKLLTKYFKKHPELTEKVAKQMGKQQK